MGQFLLLLYKVVIMKVYIAVDGSDIAEKTCKWYFDNLHKEGNEVIVGHHAEQPKLPTVSFEKLGSFPAGETTKIMTDHNKKLNDLENKFTLIVKDYKNCKVVIGTTKDSPGQSIISSAKENKVDMIVIGTRGLGMIKRKILGSVSDYVLHHAHVPVTVCPA